MHRSKITDEMSDWFLTSNTSNNEHFTGATVCHCTLYTSQTETLSVYNKSVE